jgi:anhydro-N-acetylmuramic acid kinase
MNDAAHRDEDRAGQLLGDRVGQHLGEHAAREGGDRTGERAGERVLVGLMSGTSADGIDAVVVRLSGDAPQVRVLAHEHVDFQPEFRARLLSLPLARPDELALLHVALGRRFAEAARAGIAAAGLAPHDIAAIGSPGLTAAHVPPRGAPGAEEDAAGATLALGDGDVIAALTGCTVVSDMRAADRAAGGHGAPLVPWANARLLRRGGGGREAGAVRGALNLGGIGNLTVVPPRGDPVAFDTGPGNMLLDAVVERATRGAQAFDRDGALGASGRIDEAWLDELLRADDFLLQPPPRSTGRERYGPPFLARHATRLGRVPLPDLLATLAAYTVECVVLSLERFVPERPSELVVSGGGAFNRGLMARLAARLPGIAVRTSEQALGIPVLAMEALAFALIADATLRREPSNVPSVTGARRPVVLGKLSVP